LIDLTDLKFMPADRADRDLLLAASDVLFIRSNGSRDVIGRAAAAGPATGRCFASYLIRFRLVDDPVLVRWVEMVAAAPSRRRVLVENSSSSAGQFNLSIPDLAGMPVPIPDRDEMTAIIAEYERRQTLLGAAQKLVKQQLQRCQAVRRSILAAAFRGELVQQDPNDERADVLLQRIRDERAAAGQSKAVKKKAPSSTRKPRAKKEIVA
jgi:type I restriction enzyme S subunit